MKTRGFPIHLQNWINEHRHLLKPPVGNQAVWEDREFMITVVGGPNSRQDFHINQGEEFFYQLEGTLNLKMLEDGRPVDFPIRAGEIYLMPPGIPHSPQRPEGSLGIVIERKRHAGEKDGFRWICPKCHTLLYEEYLEVRSIVTDLPPVFDRFYGDATRCTCPSCGTIAKRGEGWGFEDH